MRSRSSKQASLRLAITLAILALFSAAAYANPESKIFAYVVYNHGNANQRAYAQALLKKFKLLGFTDRMRKKGVSWVEANYASAGGAAQYLHIGAEDLLYFGVLMADRTNRMTREMYRAHVVVPNAADRRRINQLADGDAHEFYFALADVLDNFHDKHRWARQSALLDARAQRAGQVKLVIDGKDLTADRALLERPPYKRQNIQLVMVCFSPALFKRLGADEAGVTSLGGRQELWVKKGSMRLIFEVGPQLTDMKTYVVNYAGGEEKKFVSPIKSLFAYPEAQGSNWFVPLNLVIHSLYLPYEVEDDHMTETLTHKK